MKSIKRLVAITLSFAVLMTGIYWSEAPAKDVQASTTTQENTDMLNVKVQVATNGANVMRFVSSVDSMNYRRVGFEITPEGGETTTHLIYTVFKRIASTTEGVEYSYSPKVVDTSSEYFMTAKWKAVPGENYTVRAFADPNNGERLYGTSRCVALEDGRSTTTHLNMSFQTSNAGALTGVKTINNVKYQAANNTDATKVNTTTAEVIGIDGNTVHVRVQGVIGQELASVTNFTFGTYGSGEFRNLLSTYNGGTGDTSWYNETDKEFIIATSADLYGFSSVVSSGETFLNKKVYVVSDITVNTGDASTWGTSAPSHPWKPIGFKSTDTNNRAVYTAFAGIFDGCMHTISGIYLDTSIRYSGFFVGTAANAQIKNFKLKNSYFRSTHANSGYAYVGSIAGDGLGTFDTIYSNATVETTTGAVGGMVGGFRGTGQMKNCWFAGTLTNTSTNKQAHGGLVGFGYNANLTMTNCLNSGTISSKTESGSLMLGGLIGGTEGDGATCKLTINNCLNVGKINPLPEKTGFGSIIGGYLKTELNITKDSTYATAESCSGDVYTDLYTSVDEADIIGEAAETTMSNLDWTNTWTTVVGKTPKLKSFENESYVGVDTSWYDEDVDALTYTLYDVEDLYGLAAVVNSGENFEGQTILLGADIVVNKGNANVWEQSKPEFNWTPIGYLSNSYGNNVHFKGTFDGQGHTISGLYVNHGPHNFAGLFASVGTSGIVQNLRLENSYVKSTGQYLGSIAGISYAGKFNQIYSSALVHGANQQIGGMIGQSNKDSIKKCWFDGTVTNAGTRTTDQCTGGLVGYVTEGTLTIENCLNTGIVDVSAYPGATPFVGGMVGGVKANCNVDMKWCLNVKAIQKNDVAQQGYGPLVGYNNNSDAHDGVSMEGCYATDTSFVEGKNHMYATFESVLENDAKTNAVNAMPALEWNGAWKAVDGAFPEINFTYATAAEQALLADLYKGRALYQGDMHDHAKTYGRGASLFPRRRWNS